MATWLFIVLGFAALGIAAWLATRGVWMIARWIGRATHTGQRVDRYFDVEGGLDEVDYLKFKEQHPRGGHG